MAYLYIGTAQAPELQDFRDELRDLGHTEGKDILVEDYGADDDAQLTARVAQIMDATAASSAPTVVLTFGTRATGAIKGELETRKATISSGSGQRSKLPLAIVMASTSDPEGTQLVHTLAQPGGVVTGLTSNAPLLAAKRLELLKDLLDSRRQHTPRVAVLRDPKDPGDDKEWRLSQDAAVRLGLQLEEVHVSTVSELPERLKEAVHRGAGALVPLSSGVLVDAESRKKLVQFAAANQMPAVYPRREFVAECGLVAYGPDFRAMYRRAADYVDKILKGANPATLPVEKAQRFSLAVNLQAIRSFDLLPGRSFYIQVDEVVEAAEGCSA